jgi:two-component system, NarL family, nitrate/nitrite sensor histidine kinase NarX
MNINRQIARTLKAAGAVWPLALLLSGIVMLGLIAVLPAYSGGQRFAVTAALLVILAGFSLSAWQLHRRLLRPLIMLQNSVASVSQGSPGAVVSLKNEGALYPLAHDIGSINEELYDLYEDMDSRVERQTRRLAQKTASLKILYDVAATINQSNSLDELLLRFLRMLKEMLNGRAATVRVVTPNGNMRLVGSIGLDNTLLHDREMLPVQLCVCGTALSPGNILCEKNPEQCSKINGRKMFGSDEIDVVSVPLEYHDDVLGVYTIFVESPGVSGREDILDLLQTIGSHLGMAIAKQRSDEEARRLSIIDERTALANELHDSLAQTLASLRFQGRMLSDMLHQEKHSPAALADLDRIRSGLDEAHTELRTLIGSFRAPASERGFLPALYKLAERFEEATGIAPFVQVKCRSLELTPSEEMQLLRIVQESLANIRKHARANTVRILLNLEHGVITLLIEDDGRGFEQAPAGKPGEHLGLSIMQERAQRLGGELKIESEPGEGTRVELSYRPESLHHDV